MTKVLEINNCGQCPHCGTDINVEIACKLLDIKRYGRKIPKDCTIPIWCPLIDKKE